MTECTDISFIVPVYNSAEYLRECVDSILGQRDYDGTFEVILVDDGSTDGSVGICREYACAYANVHLVQPGHGGVSYARNKGLAVSRGRYIAFVDSDDTVMPHFAAAMTDAIGEADVVCCQSMRKPSVSRPGHYPRVSTHHLSAHDAVMWILYQRHGIDCSACAKLFRREIITDEPFIEGRRYEDLEWTTRVTLNAARGVNIIDRAFYYYRVNDIGFIHTVDRRHLDALDMTDRVLSRMIMAGHPALISAARERRFSANCNILMLLGDDPEVASRCWTVIRNERLHSLLGRHVRFKSRLGALLSFFGPRRLRAIMRRINK